MKRTLLMITLVLGVCGAIQAGPCATTTLSVYDTVGFSCTINGDLLFSNFIYTGTATNTTPIPDTSVDVTPITTGPETGLQFKAGWGAGPNAVEDSGIQYTVTCLGCDISDLVLTIAGASATGNSSVNVAETTPSPVETLAAGIAGSTIVLSDTALIVPPVGTLDLTKDIRIDGGTSGFGAQVSYVSNLFSLSQTTTTPEPSLLLLCAGLLCLLPVARKMRRA